MAEFLRLPNFKGCEVAAGTLLPPGTARVAHRAPPAKRLEDIPPKTWDMVVAEIPCQKVLDDKEKKKRGNLRRKSPTRLLLLTFNPRRPLTRLLGEKALGNVDASHAIEGHSDNEGGLSGLQIHPSSACPFGRRLDTLEETAPENIMSDTKARKFLHLLCFPIP
ncbi:hypothetical protein Tco_0706083 [Tanacetum coccineum]|uniref:Uncharacterized protein n=1 Tax=Tanacetum coccineum TaxID=301880 RepID=A0ABQ4Y8J3_9ASTR